MVFYGLFSFDQVVEVVKRYEIECIPAVNRGNEVQFIQSAADKTCTISMTVSPVLAIIMIDVLLSFSMFFISSVCGFIS